MGVLVNATSLADKPKRFVTNFKLRPNIHNVLDFAILDKQAKKTRGDSTKVKTFLNEFCPRH